LKPHSPNRRLRCSLACIFGALLFVCAGNADGDSSKEEYKLPPPSFRPGAAVSVQVQLVSPPGWHLNPMLPIVLKFDKEFLKDAPISVTQESWQFNIKDYQDSYTAQIPIRVGAKIEDGEYSVPLQLDCSICDKVAGACTFSSEDFSFPLLVKASADKGDRDQAQAKGVISLTLQIPAPE
jgi:hypothetical protein